jgi:signal transduction histidine kinase
MSSRRSSLALRLNAWYVLVFAASLVALVAFALPILRSGYEHDQPQLAARVTDLTGRTLYARGDLARAEVTEIRQTGTVVLAYGARRSSWPDVMARLRTGELVLALGALVLAVAGGYALTKRALHPLRALAATARRVVESGDLSQRVPVRGSGDELDEVATLVNGMLEHNQRLVTGMRDALDNVAHDLRTPLTRLRGNAELALRGNDAPAAREALADCIEETDRVLVMLRTLMDISEAETGIMRLERTRVSLDQLVREVAELYAHVADEAGVVVRVDADSVAVTGDPARLRQAIGNLVDNALKYTHPGGTVTIEAVREAEHGVVRVTDTGEGIDADALPRIWDRLFRAESSRSKPGLGLGLSLVAAIAKAHGGEVTVDSSPGLGSTFTLRVPVEERTVLATSRA